ncbi:GNAT family N-acetyltransferase [Methylovirgula sp. 4M-Z18]|uniref:GNAT family N-acetyltransferase n=1 Tax=Methylovirgula sp. 4M-Z18 TaxID=2293567 RepID=UPI000E2F2C3A|nr:GNAT family N-acetyltransferase [Methylovirgula sp. 4M-Z18]RFB81409.1 GNAT family N-acetyltransferase [Methylovirgula sp. 4M-Z18]
MTSFTLRAVRAGDAEELARMANLPGFRSGTLRIPFESVESWKRRLDNTGPELTWIVAEINEQLIGTGNLRAYTPARTAHIGEIFLGVADTHVGRGVGNALLAALIDVADNWRGLKRLELDVFADNEPAIRLYKKHGFEVEGRCLKAGFRNGEYVDTLMMARLRF